MHSHLPTTAVWCANVQEEVCAKVLELSAAKRRLAELSSRQQGTSQDKDVQQQLLDAERQVQEAAEAARQATTKLNAALQDKQELQYELAALRQQLQAQPLAAMQHATLCTQLLVRLPSCMHVPAFRQTLLCRR